MSESVKPAHECERCGCHSMQSVQTDNGDAIQICCRCDFIVGEELTAQDKLVRELWRMSDETGSPRPEDIRSVIESDMPPPETYEITTPSEMEAQDQCNRDFRLTLAILECGEMAERQAEQIAAENDAFNQELRSAIEMLEQCDGIDIQPGGSEGQAGAGGDCGPNASF